MAKRKHYSPECRECGSFDSISVHDRDDHRVCLDCEQEFFVWQKQDKGFTTTKGRIVLLGYYLELLISSLKNHP